MKNKMTLKDRAAQAFGSDGHSLIMRWLADIVLADCHDGSSRWHRLFDQSDRWDRELLLWRSEQVSIYGVNGWYMYLCASRFRLPEASEDWTAYLYRTSLLMLLGYDDFATEDGRQKIIAEAAPAEPVAEFGLEYYLESDSSGCYTTSGYTAMTREEWLEELRSSCQASRKKWESWLSWESRGSDALYADLIQEMEAAYPAFQAVLERLEREAGSCEVVRMNRQGGDVTVWYFVETQDSFFIVWLSDCM